jgi:FixJ family two-component response regulator
MPRNTKQNIFFVDDEPKIREVVGETLGEFGFGVSCFACATDCLTELDTQKCNLLITDVKMHEMDGIELLKEIRRSVPWLPVLLITGYADIPMAVRAIKAGAVDFIEKPLNKKSFVNKVKSILRQSTIDDSSMDKPLTGSETKVLRLIYSGKSNTEIAYLLHRSVRTIEVHRNHLMRKLCVDNVVSLIRRAAMMGLIELPSK